MDDYIAKMQEMLSEGYSKEEVAENLYLNYHSVTNTDEVYKIRKRIALSYGCNLNDVKLIGSSHTGYTYKDGQLRKQTSPRDYDFAIISADTFVKYFHMIKYDQIRDNDKRMYVRHFTEGKIHPRYADADFRKALENINQKIMQDLNVKRHISVCFYISEKAFINGLVKYNNNLYAGELKRFKGQKIDDGESRLTSKIGKLIDMANIKMIDRMED